MKILKLLILNPLVRALLRRSKSMGFDPHNRAACTALEFIHVLFIFIPWAFPIVIINEILKPASRIGQTYIERGPLDILLAVIGALIVIGLLNKDFFNGQSLIKRIGGYQIVDFRTLQPASRIKCLLRNVTFLIWPMEVVMMWINPKRRLGDYITGTTLIDVPETDPELIFDEMRKLKIDRQTITVMGISAFVITAYILKFLMS